VHFYLILQLQLSKN